MGPLSLVPILPVILISLAALKLSGRLLHIPPAEGKFSSIDGLRGYMALFVFLHHSCIWYFVTHGYGWSLPPNNPYRQFGSASVAIFFMITSFLFFSKLLQAQKTKMDWLKLYISRILRIMPLYLFVLAIVIYIVALLSHFALHESLPDVFWEIVQWLAFIKVNINGFNPTWLIVAGVIWSLPYEWFFYFTLPLWALILKVKTPLIVLLFALAGSLFFFYIITNFYRSSGGVQRMSPFLIGIIAAYMARVPKAREIATGRIGSCTILVLLVMVVTLYPNAYDIVPLCLLAFSFIGMACGNDLFGILTHPVSRTLGQISYSIYLLHGIILFVNFNWLWSPYAGRLSPLGHWLVIATCAIEVTVAGSLTYKFIERPALNTVSTSTAKLRASIIPEPTTL